MPPSGHRVVLALVLALVTACARMGSPAGGPEDKAPPLLLSTLPESLGSYPSWNRDVEFKFDEVISEGGSASQGFGTGDLEKLILVSPSKGIPIIRWKRDRITVRPREGWKPNRVYRIELLPGLTDLRRNKLDTTTVLTFSTGGPAPTDTLRGIAIDWMNGAVARQAVIEMVLRPDSLVYRAVADSSGRFLVGPLPRGTYQVYGAVDQNRNAQREQRESYDSAVVAPGGSLPALWLIPRDTIGTRLQTATPADSTGAALTLSQPLDPYQPLDSITATLRLQSDSSIVPVIALRTQQLDDTLQRQARTRADSIRIANDTTIKRDTTTKDTVTKAPAPPPRSDPTGRRPLVKVDLEADSIIHSRPPLTTRLVLRTQAALKPDTRYLVELRNVRSASGRVTAETRQVLVVPKPAPVVVDSVKADSLTIAPDSTRKFPRDSLRMAPTDTSSRVAPRVPRPVVPKP